MPTNPQKQPPAQLSRFNEVLTANQSAQSLWNSGASAEDIAIFIQNQNHAHLARIAGLEKALERLIEAGRHLAAPTSHDGRTLAEAQANGRTALASSK